MLVQINWKKNLIRIKDNYWNALKLFNERRGPTLAASCSFYLILSIVPSFLLILRLIGILFGDVSEIFNMIFSFGKYIFPDVAPGMLENIKGLIEGPVFGGGKFTIINFLILSVSCLSFLNAIWAGLFLISEDRQHISLWKHLKGFVLIAFTLFIIVFAFSLGPFAKLVFKIFENNFVFNYLWANFDWMRPWLKFLMNAAPDIILLSRSNWIYFLIFLGYFTFVYRWLFNWKINLLESFFGSGTFVSLLLLGKNCFWIYFMYVRSGLIESYGDYYTVILGFIWVFMVLSCFFFAACLCVVFQKNKLILGTKEIL